MKRRSAARGTVLALLVLAAQLLAGFAIGCGDFWQAPPNGNTTPTGGGGTTGSTTSTTALTASTSSVAVGGNVSFTASVSPEAATGTVTFYNGGASIGTGTLSAGIATVTTSFTAAGTYSITANYSGDSTYAASVSAPVTLTVTTAASVTYTNIALDVSDTTPVLGNRVTLTATLSPFDTTGRITFYEITPFCIHSLGSATILSGTATVPAIFNSSGIHQIMAAYAGSNVYAASSTTDALRITIDQ